MKNWFMFFVIDLNKRVLSIAQISHKMDTKMKILDEGIMNLPYDLKVLIFKIYVLYNPRIIFDIYFNDEYSN